MSNKELSKRVQHVVFPIIIGVVMVFFLGFWNLVHVGGSQLASSGRDRSFGLVSASTTETYTLYLPLAARCYNNTVPPFGVQFYGALNDSQGLDQIADAGARWIRVPFSWKSIEPSNTTPENDWSSLDTSVINATEEGIQLILTLGGQPSWAAIYAQGPVTDTDDILEFMGSVVERYDGDGVDDAPGSPQVTYFELYNEPDNGDPGHARDGGWGCWGDFDNDAPGCGNAEDYATLLQTLYPVVKDANPQAKLVFGGMALDWFPPIGPFDPNFLDNVLAACQGQNCFDVMNFHYYPPFRSHWESYGAGIIGKASYVQQKLAEHGFTDTPAICTETSWCSNCAWGSDELQSRYAVKGYVRGMAADLDVVTWFWARDGGSDGQPGLLDDDLQPKNSYWAFQEMTTMLENAIYQRPLTSSETGNEQIEGYVFQTCGGRLDVVWAEDDTPYNAEDDPVLALTVEANSLRVVDKFGNGIEYRDEEDGMVDGKITVQVGGSPLYLEYDP